jgi:hypothetical protein
MFSLHRAIFDNKIKKERLAQFAARMELEIHTKLCSEILKGREPMDDILVNGRIILKWTLRK